MSVGIIANSEIEIIAKPLDYNDFKVGGIMSPKLINVQIKEGMFNLIRLMLAKSMHRISFVNNEGGLEGVMAADGRLDILAEEMMALAEVAPREQAHEAQIRI